jgi:hypothetical protein
MVDGFSPGLKICGRDGSWNLRFFFHFLNLF